jgi:geranylgeranyl diphosphate synthase, type II
MDAIFAPTPRIDQYLHEFVAGLSLPENLREAIRYSLLGGGKRLRPLLTWHCCEASCGDGERSLPAGAAVELIHAFSLVHDDLPAMDDDDLRRGRPTLHIHAGEAMAILTGDAMLSLGFHVLADRTEPSLAIRLCKELAVGTEQMIAGQVYDTLGGLPAEMSEVDRLRMMHMNKTGALIRAACRMGAACGGADDRSAIMQGITTYAEAIGLMFQIVDDVIDVTQTTERAGKRTNKDASAGKRTFAAALGVDQCRRLIAELESRAIGAIWPLGSSLLRLRDIATMLASRSV